MPQHGMDNQWPAQEKEENIVQTVEAGAGQFANNCKMVQGLGEMRE